MKNGILENEKKRKKMKEELKKEEEKEKEKAELIISDDLEIFPPEEKMSNKIKKPNETINPNKNLEKTDSNKSQQIYFIRKNDNKIPNKFQE